MLKFILLAFLTIGQLQGSEIDDMKCPCRNGDPEYILYVRPGGDLGSQLNNFWSAVKDQKLNDPAVLDYPPHCSLTGFFKGTQSQESDYIAALKAALDDTNSVVIDIIGNKVIKKSKLDYIPLESSDLYAITTDFVKRIGVSTDFVKAKPKTFGYHISLRQNTNSKTTAKVRTLEDKYINLNANNLSENTTWALYLYRKASGNHLQLIEKVPLPT